VTSGRARLIALMLVCPILWPAAASGQALMADLSSDLVAITTGFTGTKLVLFGATDGPGDIVVVVRGPQRDIVVRRKSHVAGMWINTRRLTFAAVPSYYALFTSRSLDEIVPPRAQRLEHFGTGNLRLEPVQRRSPEETAQFRQALVDEQRRRGLFAEGEGKVQFLDARLFRADIPFPADVPIGSYLVEVYLIRDRIVVAGLQRPFQIQQVGVDAAVNEFADRQALLYGIIAVLGAGVAGWLAALPFRNA
jgi:uncharacterized protein (TIGR02186 family)